MNKVFSFFKKDMLKKENTGFKTLQSIITLTARLHEKTRALSLELAKPQISKITEQEYISTIQLWKQLSALEMLNQFENKYPHNEILSIFSPYKKNILQRNTTSQEVMASNIKLLDGYLDSVLKQLKTLEKNYKFG